MAFLGHWITDSQVSFQPVLCHESFLLCLQLGVPFDEARGSLQLSLADLLNMDL